MAEFAIPDEALSQRWIVEQVGTLQAEFDRGDRHRRQLGAIDDGVAGEIAVEHDRHAVVVEGADETVSDER